MARNKSIRDEFKFKKNAVLMKSGTPTLKQATHATMVSPVFDVFLLEVLWKVCFS